MSLRLDLEVAMEEMRNSLKEFQKNIRDLEKLIDIHFTLAEKSPKVNMQTLEKEIRSGGQKL